MNKGMIDYYVFKVGDGEVEKVLWDNCFEDDTLLRRLMHQIGWQGGTIHQVIGYVQQQKAKWNKGTARV